MKKNTFLDNYIKMWDNTFDYKGVASRSEYWIPFIIQVLIGIISLGIEIISFRFEEIGFLIRFISYALDIYLIVSIVPWISLTVRRLHDVGKSGWWVALLLVLGVGMVLLAIICAASTVFVPVMNQPTILYGPPPMDEEYPFGVYYK